MYDFSLSGWWFAGGAAVLTLLATCWTHVRNIWQHLFSRIVMTVTVSGYEADAVMLYLKTTCKASSWGPRAYLGWMLYVQPRERVQLVSMEITPPAGKLYWRGWRPIWACKSKERPEDLEVGVQAHDYQFETLSLSFVRGTFQADRLIIESTEYFNRHIIESSDTGGRRHYVKHVYGTAGKTLGKYHGSSASGGSSGVAPSSSTDVRGCIQHRPLHWSFTDLGPERSASGRAFDNLALNREAEEAVAEARFWKNSERWYKDRGLPWRRGWLLHGEPGTGKTALTRAVAEDLDLPVFAFDLSSLYNNELFQEWTAMLAEVPCMALIEDIDAVFDKRRNVSSRDHQFLTFDCLLNCVDGVERADGLFLVITTNRLERIDSALGRPRDSTISSRPGRIDRIVELTPLTEAGRGKLAKRILRQWPDAWDEMIEEGAGDTGAQFQERCARRALTEHYADGHAGAETSEREPSDTISV